MIREKIQAICNSLTNQSGDWIVKTSCCDVSPFRHTELFIYRKNKELRIYRKNFVTLSYKKIEIPLSEVEEREILDSINKCFYNKAKEDYNRLPLLI